MAEPSTHVTYAQVRNERSVQAASIEAPHDIECRQLSNAEDADLFLNRFVIS